MVGDEWVRDVARGEDGALQRRGPEARAGERVLVAGALVADLVRHPGALRKKEGYNETIRVGEGRG